MASSRPAWTELVQREWFDNLNQYIAGTTIREALERSPVVPPLAPAFLSVCVEPDAPPFPAAAASSSGSASAAPHASSARSTLTHAALCALNNSELVPVLSKLSNMTWKGWDNPFVPRITPDTARAMGIPTYFTKVGPANVRDLTAIGDNVRLRPGQAAAPAWEGGPTPKPYASVAEFEADLALIARNAQVFNGASHAVSRLAKEMLAAWHGMRNAVVSSWAKREELAIAAQQRRNATTA